MSNIIQQNYEDINSMEKAAIKRAQIGMKEDIEEFRYVEILMNKCYNKM